MKQIIERWQFDEIGKELLSSIKEYALAYEHEDKRQMYAESLRIEGIRKVLTILAKNSE